jgi:capsular polysaccharide export protein
VDDASPLPAKLGASKGVVVAGVAWWNRKAVAGLLRDVDPAPRMAQDIASGIEIARRGGGTLLAWAAKLTPDLERQALDLGIDVVRIEDGFLRSIGLGAGRVRGAAYTIDERGIYYDATRPSDLEHMLENAQLSDSEIQRGQLIVALITAHNLTKYNLAGPPPKLPATPGRERILVPGQVADDAAIRMTISHSVDLSSINANLELLRAVRHRNPGAFIVYKPHPDVTQSKRPGHIEPAAVREFADAEIVDANILDLIGQCDRVETLSSLAGFEALIRGKDVTVHGAPFYAGWGLTQDTTTFPRRTRRRSVAELVYLSLARYCRYVDPQKLTPVSCERLIERLAVLKTRPGSHAAAEAKMFFLRAARKLGI